MSETQEQSMRRQEMEAAGAAYAAAGARYLESLKATDGEKDEASESLEEQYRDLDWTAWGFEEATLAAEIANARQMDEEDGLVDVPDADWTEQTRARQTGTPIS